MPIAPEFDLNQPEYRVVNQVIERLENYLFDNGVKVQFGDEGRAIIEQLVFQYGVDMTKQYDEIGNLSIKLQVLQSNFDRLKKPLDK
jgi:hypothetical protein